MHKSYISKQTVIVSSYIMNSLWLYFDLPSFSFLVFLSLEQILHGIVGEFHLIYKICVHCTTIFPQKTVFFLVTMNWRPLFIHRFLIFYVVFGINRLGKIPNISNPASNKFKVVCGVGNPV